MPSSAEVLLSEPPSPHVEREFTVEARPQWQVIFRRFLRHRAAMVSSIVLILLVLFAFVGGAVWKYSYDQLFAGNPYQGISGGHPFGTDGNGSDMMALVMKGTQRSLEIGLFVAVVATTIGAIYGAVSGYLGGIVDNVLMRFVDLILTIPLIAVAALLGAKFAGTALGNGWFGIAVVLAALSWPSIARVIRGVVLSLREREFIEAARALGATRTRIISRHLLPNALGQIIVNATIYVSLSILSETALSFVGFGVRPPDISLGKIVYDNEESVFNHPSLFFIPGIFIIILVLCINFIGDGLRDAFDPQQNRVRA